MKPFAWVKNALRYLGIDQAVGFTLAGHLWNVASAPILLGLFVSRLNVRETGVIFNYVSLGLFQNLFEAGIGTVIQQLASRERAGLARGPGGVLVGDPVAKARLASLFRIALGWYFGVMVLSVVVMLPIGWESFRNAPNIEGVVWQPGWVLSVLTAAGHGIGLGLLLFLSGCGDVTPVSRVTAVWNVCGSTALCLSLFFGAGLLSHSFSSAATIAVMFGWVALRRRTMLRDLLATDTGPGAHSWRRDVWPLQCRISLSWLSIIVINHALNPLVLKTQGADVAGRVGFSLYVLLMIQVMGAGWVGTCIPRFGVLAAQKNWAEMDGLFRKVMTRSTAFVAILSGLVVLVSFALHEFWSGSSMQARAEALGGAELHDLPDRLLPAGILAILAVGVVAMHAVYVMASYLRAHAREPLLPVYAVLALAVGAGLLIAGLTGTATTMIVVYTATILIIGVGAGTVVFVNKRRHWHRPVPMEPVANE